MSKYNFEFDTCYYQFYVYDKDSPGKTNSPDFWNKQSSKDKLAIEDGIIGVGTECYGPVKGELVVLDKRLDDYLEEDFDHIVEAGIDIKSGIIQVLNCPDWSIELEIKVNPGEYGCRVYSSNFKSVVDDEGDDYYKIELWPEKGVSKRVIKQYKI